MKKNNKFLKTFFHLIIIISVFALCIFITKKCYCSSEISPDNFTPTYKTEISTVKDLVEKILGYIRNIAAVSSVCLIAFLGIKFMIGSTEQRAEYKKSFMPLIIGMFIVVTSSTLAGFVWNMMESGVCGHSSVYSCTGKCGRCGEQLYEPKRT